MSCLYFRSSWFSATLVAVALAVHHTCWAPQAASDEAISWHSPKISKIEREWKSLHDVNDKTPAEIPGGDGKSRFWELQKMVERLFRKRLSKWDLHQLAASCDVLPARVKKFGFTTDVLAFMVKSFVYREDREDLVMLVSKRCPSWVDYPERIEYFLAYRGSELKSPMSVLGEAYSKCQTPETRGVLAAAVRRGFAGLGISGQDDTDYVKNAIALVREREGPLCR